MLFLKIKFSIFLILFTVVFFALPWQTYAATEKFITIVNPIRGSDFFQLENVKPVTNVLNEWKLIEQKNLVATWLIRPDALQNDEIINLLKSFPQKQELGLFMEITPLWAQKADVSYRQSENWHNAGSVFLTGYEADERKKLIDSAFSHFKDIFGYYPKSVGAWWIDAYSLSYMREKYGILANMDVADQYTTDEYQVWGQYFSTPFYPAKRNALVPASGIEQKIGVVTIQWATRDPFNSYGNGVLDSTYSVQANDYANKKYHDLDTEYFQKLVSVYLDNPLANFGQVTVGLENDFSWEEFGDEFTRQIEIVEKLQKEGVKVLTMNQFASEYIRLFPQTSPSHLIYTKDPLGSSGVVVWYQNLKYRMGWFYTQQGSVIRDLRLFRDSLDEPCLSKSCDKLNLAMLETRNIDKVTYGDFWVIDEGKISDIKVKPTTNGLKISYINQAGVLRNIEFLPNDIKVDNNIRPIPVVINEEIEASRNPTKITQSFGNFLHDGLLNVVAVQFKGFVIFLIFSLLAFYLPGLAILKWSNLQPNSKFILAWPIGIAIFTLFSFVLGYLKFSILLWALPIASIILVKRDIIIPKLVFSLQTVLAIFVILIGSASWLLTSVKNGLLYDYGLGFWGPHGHDALWHLSIIENLKKGLPAQNPLFSGEILGNYHYFYDLLLAETSFLTTISPIDLYFRYFPVLISVFVGAVSYILGKDWFGSKFAGIISAFFVYFGGSFGWILTFIKDRSFGGETTFWAQQGISTLINPPLAISIWLFLAGLYLLRKVIIQKQPVIADVIPLVVLWGSLIEFKVYAGVLVLLSLVVVTLVKIFKKDFGLLKVSLPTAILSLLIFVPTNLNGANLLVFSPFWLIHSMVDFPDRLNFMRLSYARMAGAETGNWFKFFASEGIGLVIFILGNLGTRFIGVLPFKKLSINSFSLFISSFLLFSLVLSLLFIQKGANFNSVQFFYYFLLIFNFLAAAAIVYLAKMNPYSPLKKGVSGSYYGVRDVSATHLKIIKIIGKTLVLLIIVLTLPTTWGTLQHYLPDRPPSRLSRAELEGLNFLEKQPDGVVLSFYYDKFLKLRYTEPIPLYAYESTAYVGTFSGKEEYLSDTVNLDILGIDFKGRLQVQKDIFALKDPEATKMLLKKANISYVYAPKLANFHPDEERYSLKRMFKNDEVEIYKVN